MIDVNTIALLELFGGLAAAQRIALFESARLRFEKHATKPDATAREREAQITVALKTMPIGLEARWGLLAMFKVIQGLSPMAQLEVHAVLSTMNETGEPMEQMAQA